MYKEAVAKDPRLDRGEQPLAPRLPATASELRQSPTVNGLQQCLFSHRSLLTAAAALPPLDRAELVCELARIFHESRMDDPKLAVVLSQQLRNAGLPLFCRTLLKPWRNFAAITPDLLVELAHVHALFGDSSELQALSEYQESLPQDDTVKLRNALRRSLTDRSCLDYPLCRQPSQRPQDT